ncbi:cell division protein FtsZ [Aquibium carbonis]|uniref:Cell division protein FtsZ n=1 Tax=Aquibium carbonis TaxID=2495581 RepID=A0A429YGL3_9HYPH|nr:cell division protein FtsZ [Aquibium carbonis]RST80605.1 cell division protein FtsZ [Aquibium carbonis]
MTINLQKPDITELKPRITVFGVGGGGGNAVNNMINAGLRGVEFVVANTDAQALTMSRAERLIQLGAHVTEGLGAGSQPEVGRAAAEECIDEIVDHLAGTHMCFVTAGMGGGTGTGAAPVVARAAREKGILTVGVVTKPFHFEGQRRMKTADIGIEELQKNVDTLIVIPNQNLFRIANDKTTFADAFSMADQVLYSGVACITDLMVKEGLINLDFADVRSVMREMGKAMMGTGEASGEGRAMAAAEAAIANPLLDESSMKGARGLLISITGGRDLTLFEVDEAATRIREEVDQDANIILGATFDEDLEGVIRVSVVATGIDKKAHEISAAPIEIRQAPKPQPRPIQAEVRPIPVAAAPAPAPAPVQHHYEAPDASMEMDNDPVAEAIREAERTSLRPAAPVDEFAPQNRLFRAPEPQPQPRPVPQPVAQAPVQRPEPVMQQPRMPRVEDFPPLVKAEMDAQQNARAAAAAAAAAAAEPVEDRGPMGGLLKRLTAGLSSRRDDEVVRQKPVAPREPQFVQPQAESRRLAGPDAQLYAPRRGQLDDHGRLVPAQRPVSEDDQLEIPAFLRRQAN